VEILRQKLNAKLTIMPGAGHLPFEEYSREFCQDVLMFLAEHPGRLLDEK